MTNLCLMQLQPPDPALVCADPQCSPLPETQGKCDTKPSSPALLTLLTLYWPPETDTTIILVALIS